MNLHAIVNAAFYGAAFLGGIFLFIAPFTSRGCAVAHWMRVALWLFGPIAIAWSVLGFILLFSSTPLSEQTLLILRQTKSLCAGMAVGISVLLFASGEFISTFSRRKAVVD